jgi:hypothetical protein
MRNVVLFLLDKELRYTRDIEPIVGNVELMGEKIL